MGKLVVDRAVVVAVALLGVILCCASSGAWAQSPSSAGFLYIDCGASEESVDPVTGIKWVPDTDYISTGVAFKNAPNDRFAELGTLRYFDNKRKKNCYSLPVTFNATYHVRVSFLQGGDYDGSGVNASFMIGVDAAILQNVTIGLTSTHYFREFTIQPQRNVTFVCLMPDQSGTNPFISGISLRPTGPLPTRILTLLGRNQTIFNRARRNYGAALGSSVVRFPDDALDRVWLPNPATSELLSATAPIQPLGAAEPTNLGSIPKYLNPPLAMLKTAVTANGNLTISLNNSNYEPSAYMAIYFAELVPNTSKTDRGFYIDVPEAVFDGRYENPSNFSGYLGGDYWPYSDIIFSEKFQVVLYPSPTRTSLTKGPIVNGLELAYPVGPAVVPTNDRDVLAIELIKLDMNLTDWGGDPCLPFPYEWVNCSTSPTAPAPEIVAVYLSKYNLSGTISPHFAGLTELTVLALDNNKLVGELPDLHALRKLQKLHLQNNQLTGKLPTWLASTPSLTELFVQGNNFSGPIPPGLNSSNSLNFRSEGNPWLGIDLPVGSSKKSNLGIIIGAAVGGVLVIALLVGVLVYCLCCRKRINKDNLPQPPVPVAVAPQKSINVGGVRLFSLPEIVAATNNFKDEIGKGGFGTVYYGKLSDGQEIAVKVLDKTSRQGSSELVNEVDILSRVHHKNLVAIIGYCEKENPMLVYEFVHYGSLRDHLSGTNTSGPPTLDWKTRIAIALNAAQGLEYLHTACNPSFIHRDVKSSNVLLTNKLEAKVSDFGLSRLVDEQELTQVMTQVKGTPGYLDPEYFATNMLSPKTDVFSFGVVLLELLTGRLPIDRSRTQEQGSNICDWVRQALQQGDIDVILDPAVSNSKPSLDALWKVAEVAMRCVEPKSIHRPTTTEVVQELQQALNMVSPSPLHSRQYSQPGYSSIPNAYPVSMPSAR